MDYGDGDATFRCGDYACWTTARAHKSVDQRTIEGGGLLRLRQSSCRSKRGAHGPGKGALSTPTCMRSKVPRRMHDAWVDAGTLGLVGAFGANRRGPPSSRLNRDDGIRPLPHSSGDFPRRPVRDRLVGKHGSRLASCSVHCSSDARLGAAQTRSRYLALGPSSHPATRSPFRRPADPSPGPSLVGGCAANRAASGLGANTGRSTR
jgi:hypothetical protein